MKRSVIASITFIAVAGVGLFGGLAGARSVGPAASHVSALAIAATPPPPSRECPPPAFWQYVTLPGGSGKWVCEV